MTRDDDFIGRLEGYLEDHEGSTPLPEVVRAAIRAELPSTHQRPAWWPAPAFPVMSSFAKVGVAVAAVAVAALVGFNYFIAPNVGDPDPTPSPSPAAAQPLPTSPSNLEPGRYAIDASHLTQVPVTFTVPAGWWVNSDGFVLKQPADVESNVVFSTWTVTHIYGDVCRWRGTLVDVGTSAAEMADALEAQSGRETSRPIAVTIGGRAGQQVTSSVDESFDITTCDADFLHVWSDPGANESFGLGTEAGQTQVVSMVDVDGERLVVLAEYMEDASAAEIAELQSIVASIEFTP
jgi:hypothetical protein